MWLLTEFHPAMRRQDPLLHKRWPHQFFKIGRTLAKEAVLHREVGRLLYMKFMWGCMYMYGNHLLSRTEQTHSPLTPAKGPNEPQGLWTGKPLGINITRQVNLASGDFFFPLPSPLFYPLLAFLSVSEWNSHFSNNVKELRKKNPIFFFLPILVHRITS